MEKQTSLAWYNPEYKIHTYIVFCYLHLNTYYPKIHVHISDMYYISDVKGDEKTVLDM